MRAKWFCLTILLLLIGCEQAQVGPEKPAFPVDETIAEAEFSRQLKINREGLFKGSTDQIRIDAATVMLFSEDPLARKILLDALRQSENLGARVAVCKALSQARAEQKVVANKEDFIAPLFDILTTEVDDSAKFAAEAMLIFEYDQISKRLEGMVTDPSLPVEARLNAIYALRLQPDMRAIFKLIDRLDDSDEQVAAEAEKALRFLGTPIGKDAEAREQIRSELKRRGRDEFFRDLLIRQEAKMRDLQGERDRWREEYLSASGRIYDGISDDAARGVFLAESLASSEAAVRLWALEKVSQWRVGTKSRLPAELGPLLVNLISDPDRDVRLKAAKLLSLMGELDSARRLLEQLEVEQNDEIKTELFVALGWACYYAFLPNSEIRVPEEVRKQTLGWATKYLLDENIEKAQKGAEVVKKLLEQDGLASAEVDRYLSLLAKRYKQERGRAEGSLRGELLSAMAGLCAQSVYRAEAAKIFKPLFEEALRDEANLVREAAVDGLIYIDKARAVKILRKDFVNDSSIAVRKKLIDLAGEVGGQEDLVWLAEKVGSTAESEPAWQAMLKIFKGSDAAVLDEWTGRLDSQGTKAKLSDEQRISFLEMAERKAVAENKAEMLKSVRERLARLYARSGKFEQAAEYLGMLRQVAHSAEEKEAILAELLEVYLRWPNVEGASQLVDNCLLEKDLGPNNVIVLSIENYFAEPPATSDPSAILEVLVEIRTSESRPMWAEQLQRWRRRFGQTQDAAKSGAGSN
ncbi:MAG: HEAT repeat domain-containing protein [Planctomycetota bacterium]|nr:MAG: HEAT repeat domain-containing protein [Planctomycetota bacterium]